MRSKLNTSSFRMNGSPNLPPHFRINRACQSCCTKKIVYGYKNVYFVSAIDIHFYLCIFGNYLLNFRGGMITDLSIDEYNF